MDVHYLIELYPLVIKQLEQLERLSWIAEFCDVLEDQNRLITNPGHAWIKLRSHLKNESELYFCKEFAALRERLAQKMDYNRSRVISDADLITLCQQMALFAQQCADNESTDQVNLVLPSLSKVDPIFMSDFLRMQQANLDAFYTISNFRQLRTHLKHGLGFLFTSIQQKKLFDAKARLNAEANRLVIPLHYLAPSVLLEDYIISPNDNHRLVTGWRQSIVKPIMNEILSREAD
jgi:ribonuclease D